MERRDAADALLDVEERARLQVPDPELVAAGRDEDGRPRVARAPRLAPPAGRRVAPAAPALWSSSNRTASLRASRSWIRPVPRATATTSSAPDAATCAMPGPRAIDA